MLKTSICLQSSNETKTKDLAYKCKIIWIEICAINASYEGDQKSNMLDVSWSHAVTSLLCPRDPPAPTVALC